LRVCTVSHPLRDPLFQEKRDQATEYANENILLN
jgi:hypothetical protein